MIVKALEVTAYATAVILLVAALAALLFHQQPLAGLGGILDGNWLMPATLLFLALTASAAGVLAVKARALGHRPVSGAAGSRR